MSTQDRWNHIDADRYFSGREFIGLDSSKSGWNIFSMINEKKPQLLLIFCPKWCNLHPHPSIGIRCYFGWVWQILNQKEMQIPIWWWDGQVCARLSRKDQLCDSQVLLFEDAELKTTIALEELVRCRGLCSPLWPWRWLGQNSESEFIWISGLGGFGWMNGWASNK